MITSKIHNSVKKTILIISVASILTFCTFNKYEELHPKQIINCDTNISVTYSKTIAPLIERHCNKCHNVDNAATVGGGMFLDSYDDVANNIDDVLKDISGKNYSMPKNGAKLDSCDIYAIQKWMNKKMPK